MKRLPCHHLHTAMWHFTNTPVLRCCFMLRSSTTKSVWQHPVIYRQLQSYNFGVRKPNLRQISGHICRSGHFSYASTLSLVSGQYVGLLNLCTTCARHSRCVKYLQPQSGAFVKQLRHASSTKTSQSAVSNPVKQASKRGVPKASEVYRLLSLAKPEKWKLLGKNPLSILL